MSTNCLKTQLKESVSNSDLNYLNYMKLKCSPATSYSINNHKFSIILSENANLKIIGGTFLDGNGTDIGTTMSITANTMTSVRPSNVECIVLIPKYIVKNLNTDGVDSSKFVLYADSASYFSKDITGISLKSIVKGDISNICDKVGSYSLFNLIDGGFFGDMSNVLITGTGDTHRSSNVYGTARISNTTTFINLSNITINIDSYNGTELRNFNVSNSESSGDISNIFTLAMTNIEVNYTNISGKLEDGVEKLWALNKRSGTIVVISMNSQVQSSKIISSNVNIIFNADHVEIQSRTGDRIATYDGSVWKDANNEPYTP